jgi:hypothetical protein
LLSPTYLPLQYPPIFPYGEGGYRDDVALTNLPSLKGQKRKCVTMREFFAYLVQQRKNKKCTLLYSKGIFQQFLVDAFTMIESSTLLYIRTHQKELRVDLYKGLTDVILRGETDSIKVGKR